MAVMKPPRPIPPRVIDAPILPRGIHRGDAKREDNRDLRTRYERRRIARMLERMREEESQPERWTVTRAADGGITRETASERRAREQAVMRSWKHR